MEANRRCLSAMDSFNHDGKGSVMNNRPRLRQSITYLTSFALVWGQLGWHPRRVVAADPPGPAAAAVGNETRDIALNQDGVLVGRVASATGVAAGAVPVELRQGTVIVASTETDGQGQFAVGSLKGGLYELAIAKQRLPLRVWAAGTAPPHATVGVSVDTSLVTRGQGCTTSSCTGECGGTCEACCGNQQGGLMGILMNPIVIGAAIAAAIAIPLALDDDDDAS